MTTAPNLTAIYREDRDRHAVVCTLDGKLIGKAATYEFLDEVRRRIEHGCLNVIVDMGKVVRVDSTGVGILAAIYTSTHRHGGRVFVVNADERAREVLSIMRLLEFLETAESVAAALGMVQPAG
jgi:anti-anti-sigma factor